jgi:hypothetical protein
MKTFELPKDARLNNLGFVSPYSQLQVANTAYPDSMFTNFEYWQCYIATRGRVIAENSLVTLDNLKTK